MGTSGAMGANTPQVNGVGVVCGWVAFLQLASWLACWRVCSPVMSLLLCLSVTGVVAVVGGASISVG